MNRSRRFAVAELGLFVAWSTLLSSGCGSSDRIIVAAPETLSSPSSPPRASADISDAATSCQRSPISMMFSASSTAPVTAHTTIAYDIAVTNHDGAACDPRTILFRPSDVPAGFAFFVNPPFSLAEAGKIAHFTAAFTATTDVAPGRYALPFDVFDPATTDVLSDKLGYELATLPSCVVRPNRELFIIDLSVVEDPIRTASTFARTSPSAANADSRAGAWTFARLFENAAATPSDAPALAESLFASWRTDQTINGLVVPARRAIDSWLLERWPRRDDGQLDLARAPLRLLAIVNRLDTRGGAIGPAGQGRFIFGVVSSDGSPAPFTVILEYRVPAASDKDLLKWAAEWHALGSLPFPSEAYNAQLQRITDRFTARGADPRAVNGSALATVRTDEVVLDTPWELRQFRLARADGRLHPSTVDGTPDAKWLGTTALSAFINANERAIVADRDVVPRTLQGSPFLAGSALNQLVPWEAPGVRTPLARRAFSLHTCNGCHAAPETGTEFVHVASRDVGTASSLSGFLLGIVMLDPVTGESATYNELARRKADLEQLVCECPKGHVCRARETTLLAH